MTADAIADGPGPDEEEAEQPRDHARLGPYRLVQRIGEGGMGVVHLALDPHGRAVAVKVLRQHVAHDPDARARLRREVDSLGRVRSPLVAPIIDADVDGVYPYIVTRYVPGPSLDDHVAERGPLPPAELHRVASGLAAALDVIHSAGVVHRDVKPANVLLVDGEPVLIDFGIAHVTDDIRLTSTGLVMGTPGYLAPEVVGGEDVTPATDWWGWAATAAFGASGVPPFGSGPMHAVLSRVAAGDPDLGAVDPRIEPLLYAALSPDPADRPHHHEVVAALERYAHGAPVTEAIQVRRVRPETQRLTTPPTAALPSRASGPAAAAVVGGAVLGAGAAAAAHPPSYAGPPPWSAAPAAAVPSVPAPPPPPVTTGSPAGPPGWERARPVDRSGPPPIAPRVQPQPPAQLPQGSRAHGGPLSPAAPGPRCPSRSPTGTPPASATGPGVTPGSGGRPAAGRSSRSSPSSPGSRPVLRSSPCWPSSRGWRWPAPPTAR